MSATSAQLIPCAGRASNEHNVVLSRVQQQMRDEILRASCLRLYLGDPVPLIENQRTLAAGFLL